MNALEIEKWLEALTGKEFFHPGLERVNKIIKEYRLYPTSKIITIAGTNGKGSVSRLLATSLKKNHSVALFTSPHLLTLTERFVKNGKQITSKQLESLLLQVASLKSDLTYYEFLFVAFLMWLQDDWPDYIVLEVGLGGRLDATNALDAQVAVVTSIGRDHQEFLGHRYDQILREKLAITRRGKSLVTGFDLEYLRQITGQYCREKQLKWFNVEQAKIFTEQNAKMVNAVLKLLSEKSVCFGEAWQEQLQLIAGRQVSFYGSHNPAAVRKLVQFLTQEHYNTDKLVYDVLILSFSHRDKKDLSVMLRMFKQLYAKRVSKIVVTSFEHPKAEKAQVLKDLCQENGIEFVEDITEEIKQARTLLCSGSNYFYRPLFEQLRSCSS